MTGDSFEYAIKKDVRNNPIVREVDEERHREMWRSAVIAVFLVMVFLFSGWQRVELVRHGYKLEQVQQLIRRIEGRGWLRSGAQGPAHAAGRALVGLAGGDREHVVRPRSLEQRRGQLHAGASAALGVGRELEHVAR